MKILQVFTFIHNKRIDSVEKAIGYKLVFPKPSSNWIPGWARFDLTRPWRRFGLRVAGLNYFTIGGLSDEVSTRFDSRASQYQSWLGGYLVSIQEDNFTFQDQLNLAVVDQIDWLRHFGDPMPFCKLNSFDFRKIGELEVSGYLGEVFEGGGFTHSDIGPKSGGLKTRLIAAFLAAVFNSSNNGLHLKAKNLLPKVRSWSYERTYLKGFIISISVHKNIRVLLFGNGMLQQSSEDKVRDTFRELRSELLSTLRTVEITKANP